MKRKKTTLPYPKDKYFFPKNQIKNHNQIQPQEYKPFFLRKIRLYIFSSHHSNVFNESKAKKTKKRIPYCSCFCGLASAISSSNYLCGRPYFSCNLRFGTPLGLRTVAAFEQMEIIVKAVCPKHNLPFRESVSAAVHLLQRKQPTKPLAVRDFG